jgi:hypothetical protein
LIRLLSSTRIAYAAGVWSALFGLMHVFWSFAFFYWPAAGVATLGRDFLVAFGRPWMLAYDLAVATLFGVAAVLAFAVTRPRGGGVPGWILVWGVPIAACLLFLRGALGVGLDVLALLGLVHADTSPLMFYDFWFLLGGSLFGAVAMALRRAGHRIPLPEGPP